MKTKLFISLSIAFLFSSLAAGGDNIQQTKFKVSGNCEMCENRIEKAVKVKDVKFASWDKKTKMLTVAFNSKTVTADSLQKLIASAGHDTEKYKAPDAVYSALPECCLYRK
ncbi:MAG: heavy-metal-associated domain-containing protein [Bacteroidota bacterium]